MTQYIDKSAVVAEIERKKKQLIESGNDFANFWACGSLDDILSFLDTQVKEVDINKEISQFIDANFEKATIGYKLNLRHVAEYFFKLGLRCKSNWDSVYIPDIDDTLKEMGVDPDSREANSFKSSYYRVLDKLKEEKGLV